MLAHGDSAMRFHPCANLLAYGLKPMQLHQHYTCLLGWRFSDPEHGVLPSEVVWRQLVSTERKNEHSTCTALTVWLTAKCLQLRGVSKTTKVSNCGFFKEKSVHMWEEEAAHVIRNALGPTPFRRAPAPSSSMVCRTVLATVLYLLCCGWSLSMNACIRTCTPPHPLEVETAPKTCGTPQST